MIRILPKNKWSRKDRILLKKLNHLRLTPKEAYHISWALFDRYRRYKVELEEMGCKRCYMKRNNINSEEFEEIKTEYRTKFNAMQRINRFFHPYHNLLGEDYNWGCKSRRSVKK